jgi:hypothetical protein
LAKILLVFLRIRIQVFAQTISQERSGKLDEEMKLALTDVGLLTRYKVRQVIARMDKGELSLDAAWPASREKSLRVIIAGNYLSSSLAVPGTVPLACTINFHWT